MKGYQKSIVAVVAASVIWGISFLSIKVAVGQIPPIMLAFLRFVIATGVVYLFVRLSKQPIRIKKEHIPRFVLTGFLGITAYYGFQNNGILRLQASVAALIVASIPIFALLVERITSRKRMGVQKLLAVLLSFGGVYLTLGMQGQVSVDWLGVFCMFGAVISWILFCVFTTPLYDDYEQLVIVFYQTLFGSILFLPMLFFEGGQPILWNWELVIHLLFLGVVCSGVGYFLYVYSLKELKIAKASLFLNLLPLVTLLTSALFLGERLTWLQLVGAACILISVLFVSIPPKKRT